MTLARGLCCMSRSIATREYRYRAEASPQICCGGTEAYSAWYSESVLTSPFALRSEQKKLASLMPGMKTDGCAPRYCASAVVPHFKAPAMKKSGFGGVGTGLALTFLIEDAARFTFRPQFAVAAIAAASAFPEWRHRRRRERHFPKPGVCASRVQPNRSVLRRAPLFRQKRVM